MEQLLVALQRLLDTPLLTLGGSTLRLQAPLVFTLSLGVALWIAQGITQVIQSRLEQHGEADEQSRRLIRRLVYWPLLVVGVLFAVRNSGADPELVSGFVNFRLFSIGAVPVTVFSLWLFAILLFVSGVLSRLAQKGVARSFEARGMLERGTITATQRLVHYVVMAVGLGVALETVGIDLSVLFAAGAVFAVGVGFAMQNIAENFVGGLILLVERSIKPGDVLELDGEDVVVRRLAIRTTIVRTRDDEELIVPNANLVTSVVRNHTFDDAYCRVRAQVGVAYHSDLRRVEAALDRAARSVSGRAEDKEPVVYLVGFGSSSVDWEVSIWTVDPWQKPRLRSDLNKAIWWALKEDGVEIPFPQLDLHLDVPAREALAARRPPHPG